jgi:hypothetical protein
MRIWYVQQRRDLETRREEKGSKPIYLSIMKGLGLLTAPDGIGKDVGFRFEAIPIAPQEL